MGRPVRLFGGRPSITQLHTNAHSYAGAMQLLSGQLMLCLSDCVCVVELAFPSLAGLVFLAQASAANELSLLFREQRDALQARAFAVSLAQMRHNGQLVALLNPAAANNRHRTIAWRPPPPPPIDIGIFEGCIWKWVRNVRGRQATARGMRVSMESVHTKQC